MNQNYRTYLISNLKSAINLKLYNLKLKLPYNLRNQGSKGGCLPLVHILWEEGYIKEYKINYKMTKSPSMKHLDRLLGKSEALVIGSPKINSNIQIGLKYFARNLLKEFLNNKPFKLGRQKTKSNFLSSITNNKSNKCPNIEIKKTLKSVQKLFRVELEIQLRYMNDNLSLNSIYLISKPSRRIFTSNKNLNKLTYFYNKKYNKKSLGLVIISTSQGFLTNQQAFKAKLGGEVICIVF